MNHPSEWQLIYHPKFGKKVYKHKGTGVITDSLFKIGRVMKKPLANLGKKVVEKSINKASDVAVKKAGDKIESILRKRSREKTPAKRQTPSAPSAPSKPQRRKSQMQELNNLISQL